MDRPSERESAKGASAELGRFLFLETFDTSPHREVRERPRTAQIDPIEATVHLWRWNEDALRRGTRVPIDRPVDSRNLDGNEETVWNRAGAARVRIQPDGSPPGSGFLVQFENPNTRETEYAVLTANHVAARDRNHTQLALADGTGLSPVRIDGRDGEDVAVLRLRGDQLPAWARQQALTIDPNRNAAPGTELYALGFRGADTNPTLSAGWATNSPAQSGRLGAEMPLAGGMSGSPVFDREGNVLAIARSESDAIHIRDAHNLLAGRTRNTRALT